MFKKVTFLFIYLIVFIRISYSQTNIDSLKNLLSKEYIQLNDSLISGLTEEIVEFYKSNNLNNALKYCKDAIKLFKDKNNIKELKKWYYLTADVYKRIGLHEYALENYYESLKLPEKNGEEYTGWTYIGIGNIYYSDSDYQKAIEVYLQSIEGINKEIISDNELFLEAVANNNIGLSYEKMNENEKAINLYKKAYKIRKELNSSYELSHSCMLIGDYYKKRENQDSAIYYYNEGEKHFENTNRKEFGIKILLSKAQIYLMNNEAEKAVSECKKAEEISLSTNSLSDLSLVYQKYSNIFFYIKEYEKSYKYALLSKNISEKLNNKTLILQSLNQLIDISYKQENYKATNKYLKEYYLLKEKLWQQDVEKVQLKFEIIEKEKDIKEKEKEEKILEKNLNIEKEKNKLNNRMLLAFILLLILILVFLLYIIKKRRQEQKLNLKIQNTNRELEELNYEISVKNENLAIARDRAHKANEFKSEFLANMSHEIRTPLNAILGFSEILQKKIEKEKNKSLINNVMLSGNILLSLINDILDLSKIEAGKIIIQKEPVNINELIHEIYIIFSEKAKAKNIKLEVNINKETPKTLIIDSNRLKQIVLNLVSNAVKFTDKGSVKLNIECDKSEKGINYKNIFFKVTDTGIGIPKNQIKLIFSEFGQVEGQNSKKYGGTGLGLAISKKLSKLMNGEIYVISEEGSGTEFTVKLSDVEISDAKVEPKEEILKEKTVNIKGLKILYAEDNMMNRLVISEYLKDEDIELREAETGKEAIEQLKTFIPDLILMDIQMPELNGYEAAKIIKANENLKSIPIIALTANATVEEIKKYNEVFEDYIIKPIDNKTFKNTLYRNIKH